MKYISFAHVFSLLLCLSLIGVGCKQPEELPIGSPYAHVAGMKGNFRLKEVIQVDNLASGSALKSVDISEFMVGANPMTMVVGETSVSFTINDSRDLFVKGNMLQTWTFDNSSAPSFFILQNGTNLRLGHPVRPPFDKDDLVLILEKNYNIKGTEKKSITYSFKFARY